MFNIVRRCYVLNLIVTNLNLTNLKYLLFTYSKFSGHTNAVDWWTYGILIYELLTGHPPFDGMDPMARYKKILQGIGQAKFPSSKFTDSSIDLIKEVCHVDPAQRLPLRPGGVEKNL